ncbi:GNAT family N-acetyltransferase [Jannaschia donghaensis]|uniref:Ribosomal-protein-alanine acetyltransferase n=1 Tax=Jannaschia donghaensis TaxID=420998 RepID=A0A0M6YHB9_9RHOB|nr:GNAT family N-acetyltransferase [Jannaschia donghaensis]CTQ49314.1 ribosomal-protein-alanine acetyltransferase [Jannaschia donghaensis]
MTDLPDAKRIMAAVRATWPPSSLARVGPFDLPAERTGTRRATSARARDGATATTGDIAAVEGARPGTIFGTLDGAEDAIATLLKARGYAMTGASDLMAGPVGPMTGDIPPVSGFAHWPPLAICDTLWAAHGNDASRRAPLDRAPGPKAAILLRHDDRAAGALFVAVHDGLAVLHLVLTLPRFRRQGVGRIAMRHAANWAAANGAEYIVLPVEADNAAAVGLYERMGLSRRGGYRYWTPA